MSKLNAKNGYKNVAIAYSTERFSRCHSLEDRNDFMITVHPYSAGCKSGVVIPYRLGLVSRKIGQLAIYHYSNTKELEICKRKARETRDKYLLECDKDGTAIIVSMEVYRSRANLRRVHHELYSTKTVGNLNLRVGKITRKSREAASKEIISMIADSDKKHRQLPRSKRPRPYGKWIKPVKKRVKGK